MLLRQMKYFVAIVKYNSFTQAAEECFISQSAISQQIHSLESELGIELLHRENRKFTLTPAGEYFYRQSLVILDNIERMEAKTVSIGKNRSRTLSIGYLLHFDIHKLQQAVAEFSEIHDDVDINIVSGSHDDLYNMMAVNTIDVALNDQRRKFSDTAVNHPLYSAKSYIEVPARCMLAQLKTVTVQDLEQLPCILISTKEQQKNEQDYYQNIMGFGSEYIFAENTEDGRLLVAGNKGFMPIEGFLNPPPVISNTIKRIPLYKNGSQMQREYFAYWKKSNTNPDIKPFVEILQNILSAQ